MDRTLFQKIPLFTSLSEDEISRLSKLLQPTHFSQGMLIMREGESGNSFYIILEGQVEIIKAMGTADERNLGLRGPGDFLGEMSLLTRDKIRTASVRASTPVILLEMGHVDFEILLEQFPKIAHDLLRVMSLRLREVNDLTVRDLREKNRLLARAYQDLVATQAQIIEKEKIESELQVAHHIVEQYLPRQLPQLPGYDFGARMFPARAVGGDFYDFIQLNEYTIGIVVGDVSDKGLPAAILMALTRSILRAEACSEANPSDTLLKLNGHILEMNELGLFVTMLYGALDVRDGLFTYARAGHELPIWFDGRGQPIPLTYGQGQPLGIFPDPAIDQKTISIPPGNTLMIYTDGLPDAMNEQDVFFGLDRLTEAGRPRPATSAQERCDHVIEDIRTFQGANPQFDDMTLVIIQREDSI